MYESVLLLKNCVYGVSSTSFIMESRNIRAKKVSESATTTAFEQSAGTFYIQRVKPFLASTIFLKHSICRMLQLATGLRWTSSTSVPGLAP